MKKRFQMDQCFPEAYRAMAALDELVSSSKIDLASQELIRIRASQINGCAYCVALHTADALKIGMSLRKLLLIPVWREASNVFTEEEKIILQCTEEITHISQHGLTDEFYAKAVSCFGEAKTAQLIIIIVTINAWNRIGVALKMKQGPIQ